MSRIYDVNIGELIEKVAEDLKKIENMGPPEWSNYVKTGTHCERPPTRKDWWYIRAASVLRWVHRRGPVGVQKLRTKYGGKKNRGHKPERFYKSSGNIIRKILQQLEKAELVKKAEKGVHKGRVITPKGLSLLDKAANQIAQPAPKAEQTDIKVKALAKKEHGIKEQSAPAKKSAALPKKGVTKIKEEHPKKDTEAAEPKDIKKDQVPIAADLAANKK